MESLQLAVTEQQYQLAVQEFEAAREALLAELAGLSEEQWTSSPSPESWSIAKVAQHITEVQGRVHAILRNLESAPAGVEVAANEDTDRLIRKSTRDRSVRIAAPPHLHPCGDWTMAEAIARFEETHERSLQLLRESTSLRGRTHPHPIIGPMDGYQWLIAAAGHTDRHIAQIRDLKSHPSFPSTPAYEIHAADL